MYTLRHCRSFSRIQLREWWECQIHEQTDLQCGQAVLAMITGIPVGEVVRELNNDRETNLKEMKEFLRKHHCWISDVRVSLTEKTELPELCLLSLETPRCWHWSLFYNGVFYDPEHGVMTDFPVSGRKYFWEIKKLHSAHYPNDAPGGMQ